MPIYLLIGWGRVSLHSPGRLQTFFVVQANLNCLSPPQPPECWGYMLMPLYPVSVQFLWLPFWSSLEFLPLELLFSKSTLPFWKDLLKVRVLGSPHSSSPLPSGPLKWVYEHLKCRSMASTSSFVVSCRSSTVLAPREHGQSFSLCPWTRPFIFTPPQVHLEVN